jgi:hypothetical protein
MDGEREQKGLGAIRSLSLGHSLEHMVQANGAGTVTAPGLRAAHV